MKPVLFSLFGVDIYSYGVSVALGVVVSLYLMSRYYRRAGIAQFDFVLDLVFVTLAAGFFGGRIDYVLQNLDWYSRYPLKIFALWEGGLIFYGGVVGALAGVYFFTRKKNYPYLKALDFLLPYVALAHAFGRIGCFLNGCCSGTFCDYPWCVQFSQQLGAVHPTQLYEAAFLIAIAAALSSMSQRPHFEGQITAAYFFLYGVIRFLLEFLRAGNPSSLFLTWNQWISLGLTAAAVGFTVFRKNHPAPQTSPQPKP